MKIYIVTQGPRYLLAIFSTIEKAREFAIKYSKVWPDNEFFIRSAIPDDVRAILIQEIVKNGEDPWVDDMEVKENESNN